MNTLFWEERSAFAPVYMTHTVVDLSDCVQSIILLSCIVGTSFVLFVLKGLNVSEPEHWVTWSCRTDVNFTFLRGKRIQYFSFCLTTSLLIRLHFCFFFLFAFVFLIAIHSMQGWTATMRHGVTRKEAQKRLQDKKNLFRKNLQLKDVC